MEGKKFVPDEKAARRYDIGRAFSNVATIASMVGVAFAGREYFSSGNGDMVPVTGLLAMGSMYGSYFCERMAHLKRTGEDLWEGSKGFRSRAYKNFFSGEHKDIFKKDSGLE